MVLGDIRNVKFIMGKRFVDRDNVAVAKYKPGHM